MDQLSFEHEVLSRSSEEHNEVNRTEWRKLLWPIRNVKTFSIDNGLFDELSRCLQSEDGELVLGLLPKLQELTFSQYMTITMMHLLRSSMLARTQIAL